MAFPVGLALLVTTIALLVKGDTPDPLDEEPKQVAKGPDPIPKPREELPVQDRYEKADNKYRMENNPTLSRSNFGNYCFPIYYLGMGWRPVNPNGYEPYTDEELGFFERLKPVAGGRSEAHGEALDGCDINVVADRISYPRTDFSGDVRHGPEIAKTKVLGKFRAAVEKALATRPWLLWRRNEMPREEKDYIISCAITSNGRDVSTYSSVGNILESGGYTNFSQSVMGEVAGSKEDVFFPRRSKFEKTNPREYEIVKKYFNAFRRLAEQQVAEYFTITRDPAAKFKYVLFDGTPEYVRNRTGFRGRSTEFTIKGKKYLGVFISLDHLITGMPKDFAEADLYDLKRAWGSGGRTILHEAVHAAIFKAGFGLLHELPYWASEGISHYYAGQQAEEYYQDFNTPPDDSDLMGNFGMSFVVEQIGSRASFPVTFDVFATRLLETASKPIIRETLTKVKAKGGGSEVRGILNEWVKTDINLPAFGGIGSQPFLVRGDVNQWVLEGARKTYEKARQNHGIEEYRGIFGRRITSPADLRAKRVDYLDYARRYPASFMAQRARAEAAKIAVNTGMYDQGMQELDAIERERPIMDVLRWVRLYRAEGYEKTGRYEPAAQVYRELGNCAFPDQSFINDVVLSEIEAWGKGTRPSEAAADTMAAFETGVTKGLIRLSARDRERLEQIRRSF